MRVHNLKSALVLVVWALFAFQTAARCCNQTKEPSKSSRSYLSVVLDIKKDGSSQIIKATQLSGEVITRDFQTSDFIYEVTRGSTTWAVAFFAEDPFLVRALRGPANAKENSMQEKSAVIAVIVPVRDETPSAIRQLRLRIFKLLPGTNVGKIDFPVLQELKAEKKLTLIIDLPPNTFGRLISRKLRKLGQ
jgi:hypothetical protein